MHLVTLRWWQLEVHRAKLQPQTMPSNRLSIWSNSISRRITLSLIESSWPPFALASRTHCTRHYCQGLSHSPMCLNLEPRRRRTLSATQAWTTFICSATSLAVSSNPISSSQRRTKTFTCWVKIPFPNAKDSPSRKWLITWRRIKKVSKTTGRKSLNHSSNSVKKYISHLEWFSQYRRYSNSSVCKSQRLKETQPGQISKWQSQQTICTSERKFMKFNLRAKLPPPLQLARQM